MTTSRRIALAVLKAGTTSLFGQQPTAKQTPPKIVFICEHGAAESVIATAELKRLAKERGRLLNVESRGTNPDAQIAADVRHGLKADGMDLGDAKPAKVSAKDLDGATTVVSFGPDLSPLLPKDAKALDWRATPSPSKDYRGARDYCRLRWPEPIH